ncbi:hypothetical protein FA048_12715 [Pedobacter polaris]|uniref:Uncharacterized protein n=1 Tax=Pedobacter polaris TaxID=2571273 RepID=A0A4U1CLU5_9SPHI|nr:hypothetical protein [Pedobacter polaris]TKC08019.1 hypothetical protein FA048_12715 [Pedobacter polaris]
MKGIVIIVIALFGLNTALYSQQKSLNIPAIHQLVENSRTEFDKQNEARDKQAVTTINEEVNKTYLAKLKNKYRELQQRYSLLGTAIDATNIGLQATPMVNNIIKSQTEIYQLAEKNPALIFIAYQTEIEFLQKSKSLVYYLIGLSASMGAVNQMKQSDRKILFDFVLQELSVIQDLSRGLVNSIQYSNLSSLMRSLNPFQDYIDMDKSIVNDIITNAKYLKK